MLDPNLIRFIIYPAPPADSPNSAYPVSAEQIDAWAKDMYAVWESTEALWCSNITVFISWAQLLLKEHLDLPGEYGDPLNPLPQLGYVMVGRRCQECKEAVEVDHPFITGRPMSPACLCRSCRSRWRYVPPVVKLAKPKKAAKSTKKKGKEIKPKSTVDEHHPLFIALAEYDDYYSLDPLDDPYYLEHERRRHIAALEQD